MSGVVSALNTTPINDALFYGIDIDSWRQRGFDLCWTAHGGSGLGLSWQDVLDLDVADADWLYQAVGRRRREEAAAIKAASRRG